MKNYCAVSAAFLLVLLSGITAQAGDRFAESSEEMLRQFKANQDFGISRSFVQPESRAIRVVAKGKHGPEHKIVQVREDALDRAVKLKVEFDVGSARLRASAYPLLNQLAIALQDTSIVDSPVCIKGHTDNDGEDEYNLQLSYQRANAVRDYLVGAVGIKEDRLTVFGFGESQPLVSNNDPFNKQKNRRVEVTLE